jgi:hypothetical protein
MNDEKTATNASKLVAIFWGQRVQGGGGNIRLGICKTRNCIGHQNQKQTF